MKPRRMIVLALAGTSLLTGTAQAGAPSVPGYRLDTTVCAPDPVSNVCVPGPGGPGSFRDARCQAHVAAYNVGDPTTTITMYAYVYSGGSTGTGSTYAEVRCEARHDGNTVFSVSASANGPSATAYSVGSISTDALPSSLYCVAIDDWIAWLC